MAEPEFFIERRRLTRKLRFWRGVVFAGLLFLVAGLVPAFFGNETQNSPFAMRDVIARLKIEGVIQDDPRLTEKIMHLAKDTRVKAVLVDINSPGGTTVGSEALYEALRIVAKEKPVVAYMREYAASGGYITALAADYVVARGNTLTGSIGVLMSAPNFSGLLETLHISMDEIKSAPAKAEPTGYKPLSPEGRRNLEAMIKDSYEWFTGLVKERRHLTDAQVKEVSQGYVYTGRQAKALGLIDAIGDEQVALAWLGEKNVKKDLPIETIDMEDDEKPWWDVRSQAIFGGIFRLFFEKTGLWSEKRVDGLMSIWHS